MVFENNIRCPQGMFWYVVSSQSNVIELFGWVRDRMAKKVVCELLTEDRRIDRASRYTQSLSELL